MICWQNLLDTQKLQKQAYDKEVKPWKYITCEKVLLNSKYIRTKKNKKFKDMFLWIILGLTSFWKVSLQIATTKEIDSSRCF